MSFFVVGLPRSRTAWFSVFLSHDGRYCHHEGLNGCKSVQEYRDKIGGDGDSSTGLMLFDSLNAPTVIIERDLAPVRDYCKRVFGSGGDELDFLKARLDGLEGLRVPFGQIDDRLGEIWEYLIGTPYDDKRGKKLASLNIQVADPHGFVADQSLLEELMNGASL